MTYYKEYENGFKAVLEKIDGLMSVSVGVMVKTGSANESEQENGISHFIEHTVFKGTKKRSAFEISDFTDGIGANINAFTSKEATCYYTKSATEHLADCVEVLSDIFFDAVFEKKELDREKGVIIEEINMNEDSPEDVCLDLLAESYFGNEGYGRTILGSKKNVRSFTFSDVIKYMDKYYTADNVVISMAGNFDEKEAFDLIEKYFASKFKRDKAKKGLKTRKTLTQNLYKTKKIEQAHLAFSLPAVSFKDADGDAFSIANVVLGGGMSSRLFQTIREEKGLAYTVYSYPSRYKENGVLEIYAGVNTASRDDAAKSILEEIEKFRTGGITEREFLRGKEQIKSSFVLARESTASQMLLCCKNMLFGGEKYDFEKKLKEIKAVTIEDVNAVIKKYFDVSKAASATVGTARKPLKI